MRVASQMVSKLDGELIVWKEIKITYVSRIRVASSPRIRSAEIVERKDRFFQE